MAQANQTLHTFFRAKMAPNPSQVYTPAFIHAPEAFAVVLVSGNGNAISILSPSSKSFMLDNGTPACPIVIDLPSKLYDGVNTHH
jgi:hypothetical protein